GIFCCLSIIALQPKLGIWPSIFIGLIIAIITGLLCGWLNGILIAKLGIPAMLATLGSQEIFMGLGVGVTKGAAVFGTPDQFTFLGGDGPLGIPAPFIVFVLVVIIFTILLQRKQYGLELYLVGTNAKAARFSGIKNTKVIIMTHVYGGILSAIAGIVVASRANSAKASYGSSYVLQCLLVAILGGINPAGGAGTVTGVVMAILTLQFLSSGFNILRVDSYFKTFIWGAVLVGAMIMNFYGNRYAEKKKQAAAEKAINEKEQEAAN
ncbi:MAG: ABC transporter permease, partial [Eubacterium sp.]|nr:ABC transporter permease [Eubacterium sp.]